MQNSCSVKEAFDQPWCFSCPDISCYTKKPYFSKLTCIAHSQNNPWNIFLSLAVNPFSCCHFLYFCILPCVYTLFWLISIASYVFKSPNIFFQGTKYEIIYPWRCWLLAFYVVTPGPAVIRSVCKYSSRFLSMYISICPHTFFFGDTIALLWDSYTFVQRHVNVSCSYLIELMFLKLDVYVYLVHS